MKGLLALVALCVALPAAASDPLVQRGRYVVLTSGCNTCHTAMYPFLGGNVPESEWLKGDKVGWRGPWGTTYATNLRIYMQELSEEQWLDKARNLSARPPMPWFDIQAMSDGDLRAIYRYVRSLGPGGKAAPSYVPPFIKPSGPYVQFPTLPF